MGFATETNVKAVRRRHRCHGCGKHIKIGEAATRWVGTTDGEFGTAIYHVDCRAAEVALNNDVLGYRWGDDWYPLSDIDRGDWPWLIEAYPSVALRMGIVRPAECDASNPSEASAGNLATDDPSPSPPKSPRERELEGALRPFAERCADTFPDDAGDSGITVKVKYLRAAFAALAPLPNKGGA